MIAPPIHDAGLLYLLAKNCNWRCRCISASLRRISAASFLKKFSPSCNVCCESLCTSWVVFSTLFEETCAQALPGRRDGGYASKSLTVLLMRSSRFSGCGSFDRIECSISGSSASISRSSFLRDSTISTIDQPMVELLKGATYNGKQIH